MHMVSRFCYIAQQTLPHGYLEVALLHSFSSPMLCGLAPVRLRAPHVDHASSGCLFRGAKAHVAVRACNKEGEGVGSICPELSGPM